MFNEKQMLKALETVSLGYASGTVSADILIKACETYKNLVGFDDGFDYQVLVSKSLFDQINGVTPDAEISKAILPGQTKVVDGIMYIYSPTKSGSKVQYDWHVVKKGGKTKRDIGRGSKLSAKEEEEAQKFINELFPKDLSSLKTVNTSVGGSTGAKLVEDANGAQYIMKKGGNTNSGHVRAEYLTNQLYDLLGIKVPDYELYDDNGDVTLLSKFIPMCKTPTVKDYAKMAEGFIADCLLNNWDVYQNDNCLVDAAGRIIRVDNGGALDYRAQGSHKTFDDNVLKTFNSMCQYNASVYQTLTPDAINKQIEAIQKRKDDIVNFLKESGKDSLADVMEKRIDNLSKISKQLQGTQDITAIPIKPRTLKDAKEMYRDLSEEELKELWKKQSGSSAYSKMTRKGKLGWELLGEICKLRGFDARPQVVTDDEYWKLIAKDDSRHFFRGLSEDYNGDMSLQDMACSMLFDDDCFYGTIGAYGEGIYVAREEGAKITQAGYQNTWGFDEARDYAHQHGRGVVLHGIVSPDAKYIKRDDLINEIQHMPIPASNSEEVKAIQDEVDYLAKWLSDIDDKINNAGKTIEDDIYKKMHYDPASYADMLTTIDDVDWDKTNAFGEREIPSFEDFVEGKMAAWVVAQGGTAVKGRGTMHFKLPNSREELVISKNQYEGPFAIKKKNPVTPGWNFAARMFTDWMDAQHVNKVHEEVRKAKDEMSDFVSKLSAQKRELQQKYNDKKSELRAAQKVNEDNSLLEAIYAHRNSSEILGLYAAYKGYDGIIANVGRNERYIVVLNRSKLIISNKIDNV